ncbi:myristoyl CoA:protein N-myristoyltransferase [Toxoplasma gondii TgCatPRC2]|uniref:Glycylpeptide N-tetradecanoyltransferase n=1 Tax=Toxoplasma gondii TgCatPRC2 TaxID=1130821 RepID=A0A151HGV1_TOXGO|nr:myristoyl CoA:protein N-myristoyltransferase [Toxoplasma gondii TgCatPRC2]
MRKRFRFFLQAAYSFYNVATTVPLKQLIEDALCLAKQLDFDVFNALDVMENKSFVEDLKFGIGDGFLRYYIYNWRCPEMKHSDVGLVLL